ncbi:MAG: hypothetical protein AB7O52_07060 [Planctomycetota bacterium]
MPAGDVLTPKEAAYVATNSYFTLKDWIDKEPSAGVESRSNIHDRVLGSATAGSASHANTSLAATGLSGATLGNVHSAKTGFGTSSGFGYTLTFQAPGKKHIVIATRGTRPELGAPDILTDLRAAASSFYDFGPVHKGFLRTFESILPNVLRDLPQVQSADVVHCVGHSLGGAVATLVAAHFARSHPNVKLYTFGSPRVGCFNTYQALQQVIGPENIFRVAHDLDPIGLIAPFPYIHVQPKPKDRNNLTLVSPTGSLLSTANHDMVQYINSVASLGWDEVRLAANAVDYENSLLCRWLLHETNDPGWVTYASAKTLSLLFKLFSHVLKLLSTSVILGLTALDLLAEILLKGLNKLAILGQKIFDLLRHAATWAGVKATKIADFSAGVIKSILGKMLAAIKAIAVPAITTVARNLRPMTLGIAGTWALRAAGVI